MWESQTKFGWTEVVGVVSPGRDELMVGEEQLVCDSMDGKQDGAEKRRGDSEELPSERERGVPRERPSVQAMTRRRASAMEGRRSGLKVSRRSKMARSLGEKAARSKQEEWR